jgi:hypothetical protein
MIKYKENHRGNAFYNKMKFENAWEIAKSNAEGF